MRLVYITNARIPTEKAHGLQIMKSCEAFAENNMQVTLVVPHRTNTIKEGPFAYYGVQPVFPMRKLFSPDFFSVPFFSRAAAFFFQSFCFALFAVVWAFFTHTKDTFYYSRDYMTLFFLCLFGFRPIAEIHDYRAHAPKRAIGFILKKAKKVVVNSEGTLALLHAHYGMKEKQYLIAPNGVDPAFFAVQESQDEARRKLGMSADAFIMGYVGSLETTGQEKGVTVFLDALSSLFRDIKQSIVYVVGGPAALVEKYRNYALHAGIPKERIVFTGHVPYSAVPLYLRALDGVVIPLPRNKHGVTTSPMKLFEFLAAGKAIIASDLPSLRAYLNEGNTLFFKPENAADLAQKMRFIAEHPEEKDRIARQAVQDAENLTWYSRAQKIIRYIKDE